MTAIARGIRRGAARLAAVAAALTLLLPCGAAAHDDHHHESHHWECAEARSQLVRQTGGILLLWLGMSAAVRLVGRREGTGC